MALVSVVYKHNPVLAVVRPFSKETEAIIISLH